MDKQDQGERAKRLKIALAIAFFTLAIITTFFTIFPEDPQAATAAFPNDRNCEVTCSSCSAKYTLPLKAYLAKCESRKDETKGIVCDKCGNATAWLGEPPIELSDRKWNAGFVGRDMLKANLKAYHAANPEPAGRGVGVDF
jgi:hypothetical protein